MNVRIHAVYICPLPSPSCYSPLTSPNSNDDASCICKGNEDSLRKADRVQARE